MFVEQQFIERANYCMHVMTKTLEAIDTQKKGKGHLISLAPPQLFCSKII